MFQHMAKGNSFTENMAEQVEQQIRSEYGGQEVYIAKRASEPRRAAVLREFNGRNRKELCKQHGLSRAQFYRMLKGG